MLRPTALLLSIALCAFAFAEGSVSLTAFPGVSVADGRSSVTVTAEVREANGTLAPDGTQVVFESDLGTFRESLVTTTGGIAQAVLEAGDVPGMALIRASVFRLNEVGQLEFMFVADASELSTAKEYVELHSPTSLLFSNDDRLFEASDPDGRATLRYREIRIDATFLQYELNNYGVRARDATLTVDGESRDFERLYLKLNTRRGYGTTVAEVSQVSLVEAHPFFVPTERTTDGLTLVTIDRGRIEPVAQRIDTSGFDPKEIVGSVSSVESTKAVAFPNRRINFHDAQILVGGVSVMRVPLYQLPLVQTRRLITEQILDVSSNRLTLNYPYYLDLRPGSTSLIRLRYGNRYTVTGGASGGTFLDFETHWNRGDEMDGSLVVNNLLRDDWGVRARQYFTLSPTSNLYMQLDMPANRSLLATAGYSTMVGDLNVSLTGNASRSIRGTRFETAQTQVVVEQRPIRLGALPARLFIGASGSIESFTAGDISDDRQRYGLRARVTSDPLRLDSRTTMNVGYRLGQFAGRNTQTGFVNEATVNLTHRLGMNGVVQSSYEFVDDPFQSAVLGRHRLSSSVFFGTPRLTFNGSLSQGLDVDRMFMNANLSYRLGDLWRLGYSYWTDVFEGAGFENQTLILGYSLGLREVGLSYNTQTQRLGLELLSLGF